MIQLQILNWFIICGLAAAVFRVYRRESTRGAEDVLFDLDLESIRDGRIRTDRIDLPGERLVLHDELAKAGLYESTERRAFQFQQRLLPGAVTCAVVFFAVLGGASISTGLIVVAGVTLSLVYLITRYRLKSRAARYLREVEFHLPLVMERLVMAVQSGHDVISALEMLYRLDKAPTADSVPYRPDPVSRLLQIVRRLTESGLPFENALRDVARLVPSPPLRHAFIHLGLSYREGGELVVPLRELSDSTQIFYQERVEEEIAKLPVKATMPLLLLFLGLLLGFLTTPLFQLTEITSRTIESTRE